MSLLFPLGLFALAAVLLPLLIHLARRSPYTPLDFAALRWLRAQVRPRQRVRFDDWPLLLARLLLLIALALLLARPVLTGQTPAPDAWAVVAPGLDAQALRSSAAGNAASQWHWLAPGFPGIDHPPPAQPASLPSLLRELDAQLPATTTLQVHVPDPLPGLDGQRLQLSRAVQWQPHPAAPPPAAATPTPAPPLLRLRDDTPPPARHWLAAVQRAWTGQPLLPALSAGAVPAAGQTGVWTGPAPLSPAWQRFVQEGGSVLTAATAPASAPVLLRDAEGKPLLLQQTLGRGRLLHLVGRWDAAHHPALRQPELPRRLQLVLQGAPRAQLGDAADHTPIQRNLPVQAAPGHALAPWLLVLVLLLFALERWLASAPRRRQPQ